MKTLNLYFSDVYRGHKIETINKNRLKAEKGGYYRRYPVQLKITVDNILKCLHKKMQCMPMMNFIYSGSETRIYKILINNKLDGTDG